MKTTSLGFTLRFKASEIETCPETVKPEFAGLALAFAAAGAGCVAFPELALPVAGLTGTPSFC